MEQSSEQSEASLPEVAAEMTILLISCCGAVLANIMVVAAVAMKEKLHTPTYFYYLSLAASDLILGVLCIPLVIAAFVLHRWPLGDTLCQIYAVLISFSVNSSIMTLAIISVDRYNALSKPVETRAQLTLTKHYCKLIIATSWVHSVFWASGPLFQWGSTELDEFTHTCKPNWGGEGLANKSYALALAIFAFVIPVGAMVYSYVRIYRIARASKRESKYGRLPTKNSENEGATMTKKHASSTGPDEDNKALKTVLLLVGSFAACWALYSMATVWKLFAPNSVPPWIVRVGLVLTLCHCCIDPFIYSIRDERIKQEIKAMICSICCKSTQEK